MLRKNLCQLDVVDQVLFARLSGVWTRSSVEIILSDIQSRVANIKHQPWAAYVDIRDWMMPSIEAMNRFEYIYDWCAENNQIHEVTVCRLDLQKHIIKGVSSYSTDHQLYCQTSEEACDWLAQKGYAVTLPASFK